MKIGNHKSRQHRIGTCRAFPQTPTQRTNRKLAGLPPTRVHVGEDEVLLNYSMRYVERAVAVGVDARVDVWEGMPHGFLSGIGTLAASNQALDEIAQFLGDQLNPSVSSTEEGD
jgi:epsilon-lactone hydrolase